VQLQVHLYNKHTLLTFLGQFLHRIERSCTPRKFVQDLAWTCVKSWHKTYVRMFSYTSFFDKFIELVLHYIARHGNSHRRVGQGAEASLRKSFTEHPKETAHLTWSITVACYQQTETLLVYIVRDKSFIQS